MRKYKILIKESELHSFIHSYMKSGGYLEIMPIRGGAIEIISERETIGSGELEAKFELSPCLSEQNGDSIHKSTPIIHIGKLADIILLGRVEDKEKIKEELQRVLQEVIDNTL